MTISIKMTDMVDVTQNVIKSDVLENCQQVKFIMMNNSGANNTIYLTKGEFSNILTDAGWFEVLGSPVVKLSDQRFTFDVQDGDSTELALDSKLIQEKSQAMEIGQNIVKNFFYKKTTYEIEIFGNPFIQIGDVVNFIYNYGKINITTPTKRYIVISVEHNFSNGITTTIKIRPLEK